MKAVELADRILLMARQLTYGCGNHGCCINPPKGQGTNMICRCQPRRFSTELFNIAVELEKQGSSWE